MVMDTPPAGVVTRLHAVAPPALLVDPPRRPVKDALTRVIDIVVASVLLVLAGPLILLAALAVRLTSKGPAFFWQDRYGRGERLFKVVKLRTMVVDQGRFIDLVALEAMEREGVLAKQDNDPRVTPIGRFLRRTSLDELPQLWNVLRGDMALVGPRPVLPFMLDPFPELRRVRCTVRPGLTGLWQIRSREANTTVLAMAAEDLEYIRTRSLRLDFRIAAATLPAVIRGDGAV